MSLQSTGIVFKITGISNYQVVPPSSGKYLGYGVCDKYNIKEPVTWKEGTKIAFRQALEEFMNSEEFEKHTHNLDNYFTLHVSHHVNTSI